MKLLMSLAILGATVGMAMAAPSHDHRGGRDGGGHYVARHDDGWRGGGWHGGGGVSFGLGIDVPVGGPSYYAPAYVPDDPYYVAPAYVAPAPEIGFNFGIGFGGGHAWHGHYAGGWRHRR